MGVYGTTIIVGATPVVNGTSGRILYNNSSAVGEMTTSGSGTVVALVTNPVFPASITVGAAAGATGTVLFKGTTSGTVTLSTADAAGTWTMKLPTSAGTNTYLLQTDGSGNTSWVAPPAGGITIGTTTITSGTNGRVLYDNSGVVGEATVTGTLGSVVLSESPTIVTPTFTTTATLTRTSIGATSTDGLVLTNTTAASAGAQQYSPRLRLTGQGWKTNATAASQTVDWIAEVQPVQGAANPSANLVFASSINGGAYTTRFTLASGGNVISAGTLYALTWEAVNGLTGFGITYGATISPTGNGFSPSAAAKWALGITGTFVELSSDNYIGWQSATPLSNGNTVDLKIVRAAAACLQLGSNVNGAAIAQTLQACNGITGTDKTGANFTIQSGAGTGAATVSALIFATPSVGSTGTTTQTQTTRVTITEGSVTLADATNVVVDTTTGTKFGTATGQKMGWWNATPVVQQVLATGAGATVDNVISLLQTLGLCKQS